MASFNYALLTDLSELNNIKLPVCLLRTAFIRVFVWMYFKKSILNNQKHSSENGF